MSNGKQKALDKAVNEAIFVNQLQLDRAIKYVMSKVRGVSKDEALLSLNAVMISYK